MSESQSVQPATTEEAPTEPQEPQLLPPAENQNESQGNQRRAK